MRFTSPGQLLIALMLATGSLQSLADSSPFATSNRSVFVRSLGLPAVEDARLLRPGEHGASLTLEQSSIFIVDDAGPEQAFIDGESTGLSLAYRYGFSEHWALGLDLPFLSHQGGFMDSFIEGWHRAFGLPNARREEFARNQLRYSVTTPEGNVLITRSSAGIGDAALLLQRALIDNAKGTVSAQLRLEAPTGDAEYALGSGSWDAALSINTYHQYANRLSVHTNFGVVAPGKSDVLPRLQKDLAAFANVSAAWPFWRDGLSLKLQLEAHSAFYDTDIKLLGGTSAQLSFGVGVQVSERYHLNIGMSEDIARRTAPDFTLLLSLVYR